MPIMIKKNKKVLFIHIPKCGGSSLESGLANKSWREHLSIRGLNATELSFIKCSPQHMHVELLSHFLNFEAFDQIVALVRNPFDRFKSEYYWQLKQGITNDDPESWIVSTFQKFESNPYCFDNHIRPQHEFLTSSTKVFKLEKNGVREALQYIDPLPAKKNIISRLSFKSEHAHLKSTKKDETVDLIFEKYRANIAKFYAEDYEILKY